MARRYRDAFHRQIRDSVLGDGPMLLRTGVDALDGLLGGGVVAGAVSVLLGHSGCGKSTLARNVAFRASSSGHVLYLALQDGLAHATSRLLEIAAAESRDGGCDGIGAMKAYSVRDLSVSGSDCVNRDRLWNVLLDEFGCDACEDLSGEAGGIVIIDSIDMLEATSRTAAVRMLANYVRDTNIAMLATACDGAEALDQVCNAGIVVYVEAAPDHEGRLNEIGLRVIKSEYGPTGNEAKVRVSAGMVVG